LLTKKDADLRWNWKESLLPIVASFLLLGSAALVPIPDSMRKIAAGRLEKPSAIQQMEAWIEELKKSEQLDQEKISALEKQAQDLLRKDSEKWFNQSNLEAADSLRDQMAQAIRELQRDVELAAQVASTLAESGQTELSQGRSKELSQQLDEAMKGMEMGKLGLSQEMMQSLSGMDPSKMQQKTLSPEQMQQMRENLKKSASACKSCSGLSEVVDEALKEGLRQAKESGSGQKEGEGEGEGEGAGQGGVQRGRGDAPLSMKEQESKVAGGKAEAISNPDMNRATPGDAMGVSSGKHQSDVNDFSTGSAAGDVAQPGVGGEAVWRDNLVPEERAVLRRYFK